MRLGRFSAESAKANLEEIEQTFSSLERGVYDVDCLDAEAAHGFSAAELLGGMLEVADKLSNDIMQSWRSDFVALSKTIQSWCPPWQPLKDSDELFNKESNVKMMLSNDDFPKLTAAANLLDNMINLAKALGSDSFGPLLSAADDKEQLARAWARLKYLTVALEGGGWSGRGFVRCFDLPLGLSGAFSVGGLRLGIFLRP
jgi:hypothetical protein